MRGGHRAGLLKAWKTFLQAAGNANIAMLPLRAAIRLSEQPSVGSAFDTLIDAVP
ncbi:MAG TPA: hypothetical protein VFE41_19680 [Acetobacteraceae bacterium]|nr:hypothetical protein [Acetobacteraceae bacterium]